MPVIASRWSVRIGNHSRRTIQMGSFSYFAVRVRESALVISILLALTAPTWAETPINSCADANISSPGNYSLGVDLACGISIGASNVSLKLNGHKITGTGNSGAGIFAGSSINHVAIQ